MFIVGLTGGVGSGKSTVAAMFAEHGVPIIDMDILARELVQPGQVALSEIRQHFGPDVVASDGSLDRQRLRELVFTDPVRRRQLEAILHPRIRNEVIQRIKSLDYPYVMVVIPLLVESKQNDLIHHVLVIDVPEDVQIQRTMLRDSVDADLVGTIMSAQATRQQRLEIAQDVIENTGGLDTLRRLVTTLHRKYLMLANSSSGADDTLLIR